MHFLLPILVHAPYYRIRFIMFHSIPLIFGMEYLEDIYYIYYIYWYMERIFYIRLTSPRGDLSKLAIEDVSIFSEISLRTIFGKKLFQILNFWNFQN
jgi:hypothetical protein